MQVNIGREETKGGYAPENAFEAYRKLKETAGLKVRGFMAMLPDSDDEKLLGALADEMRSLYERAKADDPEIACLSSESGSMAINPRTFSPAVSLSFRYASKAFSGAYPPFVSSLPMFTCTRI